MDDLLNLLRSLAERDTAMSEFGPDEHIAGIAADRLESQSAEIRQKQEVIDDIAKLSREDVKRTKTETGLRNILTQIWYFTQRDTASGGYGR